MKLPLFVGTGAVFNGLLNDLVSYYKFDTNGSFPDAHGSNTGTISGATFTASGKINGGYDFDGVNDSVQLSTFSDISKSNAYSVSIWFKADTTSGRRTIWNQNLGSSDRVGAQIESGTLKIGMYNGSSYFVISNVAFSDTASWHHLVVTFDGSTTLTTYLDNVLFSGGALNPSLNASVQRFDFGLKQDNDGDYDGKLDESGIWGSVLTSDDVDLLYNGGAGLSYDTFTT